MEFSSVSRLINISEKSSHPEVFCKMSVPKYLLKFSGKHLSWSLFFNEVTR